MSLPKPEGKQIEVLDLSAKGHLVVLGTAGSGKTTLAIYRAMQLSKLDSDERVLMITFNTTLVKYLDAIAGEELQNVDVRNYHKFARGYLAGRGKMPRWNGILNGIEDGDNKKLILVREALSNVVSRIGLISTLKRNENVFLEEINWMQKMGLETLEDYESTERIGRAGTRILRENRKYFYDVYDEYKKIRSEQGYLYDWDDIATSVYHELLVDDRKRMYKHIIIDEGQDLSPMMLKSLALAIPQDGSLTFMGDVAQQIYGNRISWHDAGLSVERKKIWRFDRNYRNSKEIAKLAIAVSKMPYFINEADLVEPIMPTASSPLPAVIRFHNEDKELEWMVKYAVRASEHQTLAVLVRDRETVSIIEELVRNEEIRPQILKGKMQVLNQNARISIGTYHSAKGLEFDTVLMPFCSYDRLPSEERIEALESREEALIEEIKLIYVAITRAKRGLIISYAGDMTELLPECTDGLYEEREI